MRSRKAKVLHEAGGLPLVEHVVRAALKFTRPELITVVVGHQADVVEAELQRYGLTFALQQSPRGTGHALSCARHLAGSATLTLVLYGDTPLLTEATLDRLISQQRASDAAGTVVTTFVDNPTGYGRIVQEADGGVRRIVEQKAGTAEELAIKEINSGIYCFRSADLWRELPVLPPNPASGEIYLTDLIEVFSQSGRRVARFVMEDASELLGINNRLELAQADAILRQRKVEALMLAGVTIEKPETVTIDPDVQIGQDTIVGPHAVILGNTRIGDSCHIGASTVISNATLADGVIVKPFTSVDDSILGEGTDVGPFARLRNKNRLGANVHIGNFVELKNAQLSDGVKAGHLTYLGDAEVGAKTNVGAGSITCNYDGISKHRTKIGESVFIGSNSILVAPIQIGDGAFTAAGSVLTEDIPADALGVGRARQENRDGWAKLRRAKMAQLAAKK